MAGSWLDGNGSKGSISPVELFTPEVARGLALIVEAGALLSLGTTSDGGALGITVTIDGEWRREYVRTADEMGTYLAEAVPAVEDLMSASRPSAAPRKRPRRPRTP